MKIENVENYIVQKQLFNHNKPILIALSGGIDSFVMSHVLINLGYSVFFAHCNFQLRGEESDSDEKFVIDIAKEWNVKIHTKRFETVEYANKYNLSIQESARKLRYEWFKELILENDYQCVATAHNADDIAETILINLGRGCGIAGLHGIPVKNGNIVRPISFVPRVEIEEYARVNRIRYRNDSSNFEKKYTRNKIRHDVIPVLKKIFPGFIENVFHSTELICKQEEIYNQKIASFSEYFISKNNKIEVDLNPFFIHENGDIILFELLKQYNFSVSQVRNIIEQGHDKSGNRYESNTHLATTHSDKLIIDKLKSDFFKEEFMIESVFKCNQLPINLNMESISKNQISSLTPHNANYIYVDYSKLNFPLTLRHWKKGDRIYPYGLNGSKKIQDLFSDLKLNLFQKKDVWILESGGKIMWVVGIKADKRFCVENNSEQIIKISVY